MKRTLLQICAILAVFTLVVPALQLFAKPEAGDAKADWLTDYADAVAKAKAEDKYLLLDFTGSDWCPPCIKMHAEVLTQDAFVDYANSKLVPVYLDFPRRTKLDAKQQQANNELAERFKVEVFPTFVLLSPNGDEVLRHLGFFRNGPEAFVEFLKKGEARHRKAKQASVSL